MANVDFIGWGDALVYFDCVCCSGKMDARCHECYGSGVHVFYLGTFLANLSQAAGLCAAYRFGARWPYYLDYEELTDDYSWSEAGSSAWRPGCQRNAPGYVEKLEVGR